MASWELSVWSLLSSSATEMAVKLWLLSCNCSHMSPDNSLIRSAAVFANEDILLNQLFFSGHRCKRLATCDPWETVLRGMTFLLLRQIPLPHNPFQRQQQRPSLCGKDLIETVVLYVVLIFFPLVSLVLLILFSMFSRVMTLEIVFLQNGKFCLAYQADSIFSLNAESIVISTCAETVCVHPPLFRSVWKETFLVITAYLNMLSSPRINSASFLMRARRHPVQTASLFTSASRSKIRPVIFFTNSLS